MKTFLWLGPVARDGYVVLIVELKSDHFVGFTADGRVASRLYMKILVEGTSLSDSRLWLKLP